MKRKTNPRKRKANGTRGSRSAPPTNAFPVGNPGGPGRPKDDPEFVDACREKTPKALATLERAMDGYAENPGPAVKAAEVLLNRAWGTAPATIKLDANVKGEVTHDVKVPIPLSEVDRMERLALLVKTGVLKLDPGPPVETKE